MPGPTDLPSIDGNLETPGSKPETPGGSSLGPDGNSKTLARKPDASPKKAEAAGNAPDKAQTDAQRADLREPTAAQEGGLQRRFNGLPDGHPSSSRNADGSPRPATTDLRKLETAAKTDATLSSTADAATDGGDGPEHASQRPEQADATAASADGGADTKWRAELPRLQSQWVQHQERWPAEQRAPVDRSVDEEGSWRGDGPRQYLNAEENLVTEHALDRVGDTERELTGMLQGVEAEVPGARLVGLDHRLKGIERFKEKVSTELRAKPERSITEIAGRMADAVRYTYQCDEDSYVDTYRDICGRLEARGSELIMCRNYWDDADYRGLNTRWLTTNGQVFEVQFHTAVSFQAKELTHGAYERLRTKVASNAERPELEYFQHIVTSHVRIPLGVEEITNYRKDGY